MGRRVGGRLLIERFLPLAPLDGVHGRSHGFAQQKIVFIYEIRAGVGDLGEGVYFRLGLHVVSNLQIGIFKKIHGMHFVVHHV